MLKAVENTKNQACFFMEESRIGTYQVLEREEERIDMKIKINNKHKKMTAIEKINLKGVKKEKTQ